MPPSRACLGCGGLFPAPTLQRGRCPRCRGVQAKGYDHAKRQHRPRISYAEEQRRRQTVAAWVDTYGLWCPGWKARPAHAVASPRRLTAAHVYPVDGHPDREAGPLTVRCVSCNAAQGTQMG